MVNKTKFKIRNYLQTDAQAVVDVINASSMLTVGFPRAVVDAVGNVWSHRYVPFSSEKVVAVTEQDEVVGYSFLLVEITISWRKLAARSILNIVD